MYIPQQLRDLFRIDDNPIVSMDKSEIPTACDQNRSKVVLDAASFNRVKVHYKKSRKVVDSAA